jgi:nuclear transport factor 2 (NTF2) superfamily protein
MFLGSPRRRDSLLARKRTRKESEMARGTDVQQVAARRYWREPEARLLVEAWRSSGERLTEFARRHDFEPKRLARWVRCLETDNRGVGFHAVRLVQRRPEPEGPIEIELARGQLVRVPRGFEAEDLRRVLAVLGEVERC